MNMTSKELPAMHKLILRGSGSLGSNRAQFFCADHCKNYHNGICEKYCEFTKVFLERVHGSDTPFVIVPTFSPNVFLAGSNESYMTKFLNMFNQTMAQFARQNNGRNA
jgi:hypothetical protein